MSRVIVADSGSTNVGSRVIVADSGVTSGLSRDTLLSVTSS